MKAITGLDNPNSVVQMKGWLSEHGVEAESLGKKDVAKLITDVDGEVRDALILRQQLALGYGGSVGALKSMGALEMGLLEEELQPLVDSWRSANPNIVRFWWEFDRAVKQTVKKREDTEVKGIRFSCRSGMLFIELPSGRRLSYVKPRIGENRFGGESVTYEGVGGTKKWERIESYGPKFVENIVQAISRDILCYAMRTLSHCLICAHVHDELIIECREDVSLEAICEQMGRTPPWAEGLVLRADGYCTKFYKKD
jgi:DNA polymerase